MFHLIVMLYQILNELQIFYLPSVFYPLQGCYENYLAAVQEWIRWHSNLQTRSLTFPLCTK